MTVYKCMKDGCETEEKYSRRDRATSNGWRFNLFQIDGQLYMYSLCKEHKEEEDIPDFQEIYDYHDEEEIEEMKNQLIEIESPKLNRRNKGVIDSAGGKSHSLDNL